MSVRVRFAPSPTGKVHIGNIRVAIFNWLFARHEGGRFLLRIEDTDRERHTPEAVEAVLDIMNWLGLDYDEDPVCQSSRFARHGDCARRLLESGAAYLEDKGGTGKGECTVFRMPRKPVSFVDEIKGELRKDAEDLHDFVIVRSDGAPTFHLANVVDDMDMGITHVIRGDDHVENTFKQVALFQALGAELPRYAHLPMVVNQHGKPYSKRDGDCFAGQFRDRGFVADAMVNYLALLGWSPGGDREKMSREELILFFTLDRVRSSPSRMDIRKWTHLNGQYIAEQPLDEFVNAVSERLKGEEWADNAESVYFRKVCALMQSRTHLYSYASGWKYFFSEDFEYDEKAVRKMLKKEGRKRALEVLKTQLESIGGFSEESAESSIRKAEETEGIKAGKLNQPVRVAVTGTAAGAGLYETMVLLGKNRCLKRLDYAAAHLCGSA